MEILSVPVLTMHTLGDMVATFRNEIDYYDLVAEQGKTDSTCPASVSGYPALQFHVY